MSMIRCEICHIKTSKSGDKKRIFMAKFPLNEDRCKQWVAATGNEDLVYVPIEKLHQLKYICGKHFLPKDFSKKKSQLRKAAIPRLNLAVKVLTEDVLKEFPCHIAKDESMDCAIVDHNYCHTDMLFLESTTSETVFELFDPQESRSASEASPTYDSQSCSPRAPSPTTLTSSSQDLQRSSHSPGTSDSSSARNQSLSSAYRKLLDKLKISQTQIRNLQKKVNQLENSSPVFKSRPNKQRKPNRPHCTRMNKLALDIQKSPEVSWCPGPLENMEMEPGINPTIMMHLKKTSERLPDKDKLVVLLFDTIPLTKTLIYNSATDQMDGYEDLGEEGGRSTVIADCALVFMLQGVSKKIKQPIAYYFVSETIATEKVSVMITSVIKAVTEAGFTVLCTVCDQGPMNISALNLLKTLSGNSQDSNYFLLDDDKIFVVYDVPHLFKSIRNNFNQGGELTIDNRTGKWSHLVKVEEKNQTLLQFDKITKLHIDPKFRSKLRVKLAAEMLSNTVAAILKLLADSEENVEEEKGMLETAHVVEELDRLFDCTNGPASRADITIGLREYVSKNSFHHELWPEYKRKLQTLMVNKTDNLLKLRNERCVNGYIITITSFQDIWKRVDMMDLKYLNLRHFNQDPLENFFGLIMKQCPTNKMPTCHHFTKAFKSVVLSSFTTSLSEETNWE